MNSYNHLLSFDLTSYGAAMSIVNQFVDHEEVRDFELSPCGSGAQLILLGRQAISLSVLRGQAESLYKSQIIDSSVVENIHPQLLETYLAQNKVSVDAHMIIFEGSSLSEGFSLANEILNKSLNVLEFRMIRGASKNVMITVSDNNLNLLTEISCGTFKKTVIENIQTPLRSYWQF